MMSDNTRKVTSCCNYPLLYKDEGDGLQSEWEFCGECLDTNWEIVKVEQ